ncbi:non-specific lipid-transfer protein-like protein At5g64080 [Punica granatum]|uniref:Non-specific lipid-transfer protein-like protein At5g64080 n=1 Tax=Punica granatum TaxID=22663 RepID=A0A6P8E7D2_PUNGR|nr:non-specific lipid-transfer protein-like protein At5g64080 [Punica granatum]
MAVPAPAPAITDVNTLCSDIIFNMLDCLPYLSDGSTTNKPGDSCCSGAESVLEFNGQCICVALKTIEAPNLAPEPEPLAPASVETLEPESPTPAPAQTPDLALEPSCSDVIFNMTDCIAYLSKNSPEDQPQDTCCPGFKSVMYFNHECVCEAIKSSSQLGIDLNMTRIEDLPSICGIHEQPLEYCRIESASPSPIPSTPSPPKSKEHMKPRSKTQAPAPAPKHRSGSRSLVGSSFAAFVSSTAVVSILFLHK